MKNEVTALGNQTPPWKVAIPIEFKGIAFSLDKALSKSYLLIIYFLFV